MENSLKAQRENNLQVQNEQKIPTVTLYFEDGSSIQKKVGDTVRGVSHNGKRPTSLSWDNLKSIEPTSKNLDWLFNELIYVFDKDVDFQKNILKEIED